MNRRVRVALGVGTVLLIGMGYLTWAVSQSEQVARVGQPLPKITLPTVTGSRVSLTTLRGKPILLDFFTTWCGPCQTEAPAIEKIAHQWQGKVQVVLIDRGESPYVVKRFAQQYGLATPTILIDKNDTWAARLGVTGQPETFLISSQGVILAHVDYEMTQGQLQAMAVSATQPRT